MTPTFLITNILLTAIIVAIGSYFIFPKNIKPYLVGYGVGLLVIIGFFLLGLLKIHAPPTAIVLTAYTILFSLVIGALSKNYYWLLGLMIVFLYINRKTVRYAEGRGSLALINLPDEMACGDCGGSVSHQPILIFIYLIPVVAALVAFWVKKYLLNKVVSVQPSTKNILDESVHQ